MKRRVYFRLAITLSVVLACLHLVSGIPPTLSGMSERIRLGLDLGGGAHLEIQVMTDDAIRAETDQTTGLIREALADEGLFVGKVERVADDELRVVGVPPGSQTALGKILSEQFPQWARVSTEDDVSGTRTLRLRASAEADLRSLTVEQAIRTLQNRIDSLGVAEATVQRYGGSGRDRILVQLPGVDDPERVREIMQSTAFLEFRIVEGGPYSTEQAARDSYGSSLPGHLEVLESGTAARAGQSGWYVVERVAEVTGRDLRNATPSRDQNGRPAVTFFLNAAGSDRFARLTEANVGRFLAIVLDGRVQSAPRIDNRISETGVIVGGPTGFTLQESQDLAVVLRSGALPASLEFLKEGYVSASLGADSIRRGVAAGAVSLLVVLLFIVSYYRLSGAIAGAAMVVNVMILLGAMAYLEAPLTLPGMAGIILTIGVGIDSNILIFERIREELRAGQTVSASVRVGFKRVFATIIDTHLAALIAAMFLFFFGTGPVRGFAVTLTIGLISNVFTAVFVSRTLFEWFLMEEGRAAFWSI